MHNAQVCYFNNVWLMFLVFLKNFSFQTTVGPPPRLNPLHFPLWFFTSSTRPRPVFRISHSGSLPRRPALARSFAFPIPVL